MYHAPGILHMGRRHVVSAMQTVLIAEDVEVVYPSGARALHPTRLSIEAGQFVVLLGASGAGKSTLLRALNGLVQPSAGRVVVPGLGSLEQPRLLHTHRRRTGMVFQQHHLIGRLSVLANVLMGRLGHYCSLSTLLPWSRADKERALAALERVDLLEHALRRADELSGGQQQRVGIARALVQQPRLLLADEPVASLDPATAERVLSLLHAICKADGLTAVVSLHQVPFARRFADRIVGLAAGRVLFDGAPAEVSEPVLNALYGVATAMQFDHAIPAPASVRPPLPYVTEVPS